MATQAYFDWVADGKPWHRAVPVAQYQAAFLKAGWPPNSLGTLGDLPHLTADRPQDHTPFSVTGWPLPNPYPWELAFDAGHLPDQGFDMAPIVDRWLRDAMDGKTPWVKYIVWRGEIYDVRRDWVPAGASGHYDHAHVSFRTDWYQKSIGAYGVVTADTGDDAMLLGLIEGDDTVYIGTGTQARRLDSYGAGPWVTEAFNKLKARIGEPIVFTSTKALEAALGSLAGGSAPMPGSFTFTGTGKAESADK